MICQECQERPATFHFTKVVNGEKTEVHICEYCAKEKGEVMFSNSGFSVNNLLSGLLNIDTPMTQKEQSIFHHHDVLQCEQCKMTYPQFTKIGRFGCSNCYRKFRQQIQPLLRRVHSGNSVHAGKVPKRIGGTVHLKKKVDELREKLQKLIVQEEFEQAALVRDEIRSIESKLNGPSEESE